jgi:hypothetical protein
MSLARVCVICILLFLGGCDPATQAFLAGVAGPMPTSGVRRTRTCSEIGLELPQTLDLSVRVAGWRVVSDGFKFENLPAGVSMISPAVLYVDRQRVFASFQVEHGFRCSGITYYISELPEIEAGIYPIRAQLASRPPPRSMAYSDFPESFTLQINVQGPVLQPPVFQTIAHALLEFCIDETGVYLGAPVVLLRSMRQEAVGRVWMFSAPTSRTPVGPAIFHVEAVSEERLRAVQFRQTVNNPCRIPSGGSRSW